ncbi:BI1-like protein [Carex littledalei]|uniref:BI1-like protein n=1 Tax=Carex littledalei TaxID=544730 RepID=A0A833QH08_9POAL|nr:BI1-like protein [Carex littledalei]
MGKSSNHYGNDIELGGGSSGSGLYPNMVGDPQLRWAFIRKVYSILTFQLLITVIVAAVFVFVPAIQAYFRANRMATMGFLIGACVAEFIVLLAMYFLKDRHPLNIFLLLLFTMCTSIMIGLVCMFASGRLVLQAAGVTVVVFLSLTMYTFWAAKKGKDFNFLGPFLFAAIITLSIFSIIQFFFPLGKTFTTLIAGIAVLIFCAFIIYDTDNIIKRFDYDDYVIASVDLYLDIINLFLYLLQIFSNLE